MNDIEKENEDLKAMNAKLEDAIKVNTVTNDSLKAMNTNLQRELTKALEVIAGVAKAMKGEGK